MSTMPPRFFRIGLLAVCAAFCATAAVRPATFRQSEGASRATPAEAHLGTLLVFPFEDDGRMASLDWLGEGLAELTVERLQDRGLSVLSRQERLAVLEKIGLPDSARFSHATMVKIAAEADADEVVFGRFVSDGKAVTLEARVLRISPPSLFAGSSRRTTNHISAPCVRRRVWSLPGTVLRSNLARSILRGATANRLCHGFRACRPIARTAPRPASTPACATCFAMTRRAPKRHSPA